MKKKNLFSAMGGAVLSILLAACAVPAEMRSGSNQDSATSTELTPLSIVQKTCYLRDIIESELQDATPEKRELAKAPYRDLRAHANSHLKTLAVAVRNKKGKDPSLKAAQQVLADKAAALSELLKPSAAGSGFDWISALVTIGKEAIVVARQLRKEDRDKFASDIESSCPWRTMDEIVQPGEKKE